MTTAPTADIGQAFDRWKKQKEATDAFARWKMAKTIKDTGLAHSLAKQFKVGGDVTHDDIAKGIAGVLANIKPTPRKLGAGRAFINAVNPVNAAREMIGVGSGLIGRAVGETAEQPGPFLRRMEQQFQQRAQHELGFNESGLAEHAPAPSGFIEKAASLTGSVANPAYYVPFTVAGKVAKPVTSLLGRGAARAVGSGITRGVAQAGRARGVATYAATTAAGKVVKPLVEHAATGAALVGGYGGAAGYAQTGTKEGAIEGLIEGAKVGAVLGPGIALLGHVAMRTGQFTLQKVSEVQARKTLGVTAKSTDAEVNDAFRKRANQAESNGTLGRVTSAYLRLAAARRGIPRVAEPAPTAPPTPEQVTAEPMARAAMRPQPLRLSASILTGPDGAQQLRGMNPALAERIASKSTPSRADVAEALAPGETLTSRQRTALAERLRATAPRAAPAPPQAAPVPFQQPRRFTTGELGATEGLQRLAVTRAEEAQRIVSGDATAWDAVLHSGQKLSGRQRERLAQRLKRLMVRQGRVAPTEPPAETGPRPVVEPASVAPAKPVATETSGNVASATVAQARVEEKQVTPARRESGNVPPESAGKGGAGSKPEAEAPPPAPVEPVEPPKPPEPPTPPEPPIAQVVSHVLGEEGTTSARKASMADDRKALGLDELNSPERRTWVQTLADARAQGVPDKAIRIADQVIAQPRSLSDVETAGMVIHAVKLKNEHRAIMEEIGASKDKAEIATKSAELKRIEQDFDTLSHALRVSGTEKGRTLAAQKLTLNKDYDLVSVLNRAKVAKGRDLNASEKAKIEELTKKLQEANERADKATERAMEQKAERALKGHRRAKQSREELMAKVKELIQAGCNA